MNYPFLYCYEIEKKNKAHLSRTNNSYKIQELKLCREPRKKEEEKGIWVIIIEREEELGKNGIDYL